MGVKKALQYIKLEIQLDLDKFKRPKLVLIASIAVTVACLIALGFFVLIYLLRSINSYENPDWSVTYETKSQLQFPIIYACHPDGAEIPPPTALACLYGNSLSLDPEIPCAEQVYEERIPLESSQQPGLCRVYNRLPAAQRDLYSRDEEDYIRLLFLPKTSVETRYIPGLVEGISIYIVSRDGGRVSTLLIPKGHSVIVTLQQVEAHHLDGGIITSYVVSHSKVPYNNLDYSNVVVRFATLEVEQQTEVVSQDIRWFIASVGAIGVLVAAVLRFGAQMWYMATFDDERYLAAVTAIDCGNEDLLQAARAGYYHHVLEKLTTGSIQAVERARRPSFAVLLAHQDPSQPGGVHSRRPPGLHPVMVGDAPAGHSQMSPRFRTPYSPVKSSPLARSQSTKWPSSPLSTEPNASIPDANDNRQASEVPAELPVLMKKDASQKSGGTVTEAAMPDEPENVETIGDG